MKEVPKLLALIFIDRLFTACSKDSSDNTKKKNIFKSGEVTINNITLNGSAYKVKEAAITRASMGRYTGSSISLMSGKKRSSQYPFNSCSCIYKRNNDRNLLFFKRGKLIRFLTIV